jgi:hypothetical protein
LKALEMEGTTNNPRQSSRKVLEMGKCQLKRYQGRNPLPLFEIPPQIRPHKVPKIQHLTMGKMALVPNPQKLSTLRMEIMANPLRQMSLVLHPQRMVAPRVKFKASLLSQMIRVSIPQNMVTLQVKLKASPLSHLPLLFNQRAENRTGVEKPRSTMYHKALLQTSPSKYLNQKATCPVENRFAKR